MNLLLDTQVALWWLTASSRLSKRSRESIASSDCAVSVASLWEVAIKHRIGKLPVTARRVRDELTRGGATLVPLTDEHILAADDVPGVLADPFDRVLLAVAMAEGLVLLTADSVLLDLAESHGGLPIHPV